MDFQALNQSFLAWVEQRKLFTLVPFLEWAIASEGYGSLDWIPAFYGLQFFHPRSMQLARAAEMQGFITVVREGMQTLWERLLTQACPIRPSPSPSPSRSRDVASQPQLTPRC